LFIAAFGIKCFDCKSEESAEDCAKHQKEESCAAGQDGCVTATKVYSKGNTTAKIFRKLCFQKVNTEEECSQLANLLCNNEKGNCTATMKCCNKDLCNGSTLPTVSAFVTVACAFVSLLR